MGKGGDSRLGLDGGRGQLPRVQGTVHFEVLERDEVLAALAADEQLRLLQLGLDATASDIGRLPFRRGRGWNGHRRRRRRIQGAIHFQTLAPGLLRRLGTGQLHPGRDGGLAGRG